MKGREAMDGISKPADEAGAQPAKKRKRRVTDAKRASDARYKKEKRKMIRIGFYPPDYDLYEHVMERAKESNTSAYIKSLIREDMERSSR